MAALTSQRFWRRYNEELHRDLSVLLLLTRSILDAWGVTYWLHAGNLLAAVRDGVAFVPWDDDADLAILAPADFNLLRILFETYAGLSLWEKTDGHWVVLDEDSGLFVDLFMFGADGRPLGDRVRQLWPAEYYQPEELFPLRRTALGPLPKKPEPFLDRAYPGWRTDRRLGWMHHGVFRSVVSVLLHGTKVFR